MNRQELLITAAGPLEVDRESTYGDFHKCMDSFGRKARKMFLDYEMHKRYSDAHNGAFLLGQLKDIRILMGQYHEDNYLDGVNYRAQANASQRFDTMVEQAPEEVVSGSIGGIRHNDIPASAFEPQMAGHAAQMAFGIGEVIFETPRRLTDKEQFQMEVIGDCMMELVRRIESMKDMMSAKETILVIRDDIDALKRHLPDDVRCIINVAR